VKGFPRRNNDFSSNCATHSCVLNQREGQLCYAQLDYIRLKRRHDPAGAEKRQILSRRANEARANSGEKMRREMTKLRLRNEEVEREQKGSTLTVDVACQTEDQSSKPEGLSFEARLTRIEDLLQDLCLSRST
jgi:hypothetical protein